MKGLRVSDLGRTGFDDLTASSVGRGITPSRKIRRQFVKQTDGNGQGMQIMFNALSHCMETTRPSVYDQILSA